MSNPIYVGRIAHKGQVHEGQHPPIVDQDLWDRVQQSLRNHLGAAGTAKTRRSSEALLAGKLFDDRGNRMSPTWARKGSKRWRYYVSQAALQGDGLGALGRERGEPLGERGKLGDRPRTASSVGDGVFLALRRSVGHALRRPRSPLRTRTASKRRRGRVARACARDVARASASGPAEIPPQAYFEPINWHRTALHELGHYAEPRIMPHGADWGGPTVFGIIRALRGRRAACHPGDIGPVTVTLRSVTSPLDSE